MKFIVVGRSGSGKTTFINQVNDELTNKQTKHQLVECSILNKFLSLYDEGDNIIIIDTPLLLCEKRKQTNVDIKIYESQEQYLKHVTDLPDCTIIKNDSSTDALRVKTKKFIKRFL